MAGGGGPKHPKQFFRKRNNNLRFLQGWSGGAAATPPEGNVPYRFMLTKIRRPQCPHWGKRRVLFLKVFHESMLVLK